MSDQRVKIKASFGLLDLTIVLGWRYRFGTRPIYGGRSVGFGIGWARWMRRLPVTGRRLRLAVSKEAA